MDVQLLAALILGVATVVAIILWSRVDAFVGLLAGSLVTGAVAGMPVDKVLGSMTDGFGGTLADIGIVIALGVMIGKILEKTGGADALAKMFVRLAGKGREDVAMTATGAVVSVPVFCDSGFVILHPLARSLARRYGKPLVTVCLALAGGLAITHHLVPPTPGPLAAVGLLHADLGTVVLIASAMAVVLIPVVVAYARYMGPRLEFHLDPDIAPEFATAGGGSAGSPGTSAPVRTTEDGRDIAEEPPPPSVGAFRAAIPLLLPLLLIVGNTVSGAVAGGTRLADLAAYVGGSWLAGALGWIGAPWLVAPFALIGDLRLADIFGFIGEPAIALLIGLVIAAYLLPSRRTSRSTVISWLTAAAASAGMIVFITGAGGAFGEVLNQSGVGDALAKAVSTWPVPMFLMPFLIASLVRVAQGSGTVAIITAATLSAPIVSSAGLSPTLAVLSACAGSFVFSYVSDSYFWVVTRFTGLSGGAAMRMWSGMTTVLWLASIPMLGLAALVL